MQLRRLVEASGMLEHVHFVEQLSVVDDDAVLRPDMVIELGEGRRVVVDAKVSLDAFLDPDIDPQEQAQRHAAAVADHVNRLSSKQYWRAVDTPEFVIMFLPAEHMLGVALQARPDLLQSAFDKKIVLATPTTLMATLRSISWAWQQAAMAQEACEVLAAGRQVHDRLTVMGTHIARLGKHLGDAVTGYNQFIGSFDSRVMPSARRLAQLAAPEAEVLELPEIDVRARTVVSLEDQGVTRDTG
jgi:DNA recombination protein RmuC